VKESPFPLELEKNEEKKKKEKKKKKKKRFQTMFITNERKEKTSLQLAGHML